MRAPSKTLNPRLNFSSHRLHKKIQNFPESGKQDQEKKKRNENHFFKAKKWIAFFLSITPKGRRIAAPPYIETYTSTPRPPAVGKGGVVG